MTTATSSTFDPVITVFKNFWETDKPHYVRLSTELERIRSGASRDQIMKIKSESNKDEQTRLKKNLPCILFAGRFTIREDKALTEHSGLIILDFDNLDNPFALKEEFSQKPWVKAVFISPRQNGIKVLVRIPAVAGQHRGHFAALKKLYPQTDPTSINPSRICFECYDQNIFIREDPEEFTEYIAPEEKPPVSTRTDFQGNVVQDYSKLNVALNMIRRAAEGERHHQLLKAAHLIGGYIAAGYVEEEIATQILAREWELRGDDGRYNEEKTIRDAIRHGMSMPIYTQDAEEDNPDNKTESNNGIIYLDQVWEEMQYTFKNGKKKGQTTHFPGLDKHFTWKKGEITLWSGVPNSGKSEFLYQLCMMKSVYDRWKWAIFSPENTPAAEFYDQLIQIVVGKSVDKDYRNKMTMEEYAAAAAFVREHFFLVYPETKHTTEEIMANFDYAVRHHQVDGVIIDPFNKLARRFTSRDDRDIEEFMGIQKRFALEHNICYGVVIHPKSLQKMKDTGAYPVVDFYDLAGGAMWSNATDNFISIHRPEQFSDPNNPCVDIHVKKIKKQKLVGIPGTAMMTYDRATSRYYENAYNPLQSHNPIMCPTLKVFVDPEPNMGETKAIAVLDRGQDDAPSANGFNHSTQSTQEWGF